MTTYVYETITQKAGEKPRYHEIKQSMSDAALTKHPETGEPIRRVVLGGFGTLRLQGDQECFELVLRLRARRLLRLNQEHKANTL